MLTLLALAAIAAANPAGVPAHVTPDAVVWHAAPPPFPAGTMTIDVPLERVIARAGIAKPLRMWIFLLRKTGESSARPVARTPTIVLNVK